jgi:hypothetical protein
MEKATKEEAEYHLPERCCANCEASYRSSYGDSQCTTLHPAHNLIDAGGVCKLWEATR